MRDFRIWNQKRPQKSHFEVGQARNRLSTRAQGLHKSPHRAWDNRGTESTFLPCSICDIRKEKRFCPAVHGRICPQCCGEQREVTLDCPRDCTYLRQAREHEKLRSLEGLDPAELFPSVEIGDQFLYEHEHLLMGLSFVLAKSVNSDRTLRDCDLLAALGALAKSYETLVNAGLHYEAPLQNPAQQAIVTELQTMVKEFREAELKHTGYSRLRDSDALQALVFLLRMGFTRTSGRPKARGFADFVVSQFPNSEGVVTNAEEKSRIIVP
jgi:hypothetical protein